MHKHIPGKPHGGPAPKPPAPAAEGLMGRAQLRVLVVDDSRDLVDTLCDYLELTGHSPVSATDGDEGLELFRAGGFDIVVTDFHMPRMSGLEMLAEIRKLQPDMPVILAFGAFDDDDRLVLAAGASAVLHKPFSMDALEKEIRRLTGK